MIRSSVVFPAPLRPFTDTTSPGCSSSSSPSSVGAGRPRQCLHRPSTASSGSAGAPGTWSARAGRATRKRSSSVNGIRAPSLDRGSLAHGRAVAAARDAAGAIVAAVGSGHVAQPPPPDARYPPLGDPWSGRAFGLSLAGTLALESVVSAAAARTPPDTWLEQAPRA